MEYTKVKIWKKLGEVSLYISRIHRLSLNTRIVCKMFTAILKNKIQERNKIWLLIWSVIKIFTEYSLSYLLGAENISLVFIAKSYFQVLKDVTLNTTHFYTTKIPNRQKLQQNAVIHKSYTDFNKLKRVYRKYTAQPY